VRFDRARRQSVEVRTALLSSIARDTKLVEFSCSNICAIIASAFGPTPPGGGVLVAAADFDGNKKPDYLFYNPGTRQTVISYLNNNVFVSTAFGPTIPPGWRLVGQ
jgi:hypothetical protein